MEKLIVDRIVGGILVLEKEDLSHIEVKSETVPFSVSEGDVLLFDGEKYIKDIDNETVRRKRILEMQEKLKKKSNNG